MESTIISTSHTRGKRIVVLVVIVILAETTILRGVGVLNWIGPRTTEIVTSPPIGMILKMVQMALGMEAMVESQQTSTVAQSIRQMDPVWTFKLGQTVTTATAKHMQ